MSPTSFFTSLTGDILGSNDLSNSGKFVPTSVFEEVEFKASAAEKKASHLNSLLRESESENARLTQLAAVLKVNNKRTFMIYIYIYIYILCVLSKNIL